MLAEITQWDTLLTLCVGSLIAGVCMVVGVWIGRGSK